VTRYLLNLTKVIVHLLPSSKELKMWMSDGRRSKRVTSTRAREILTGLHDFEGYSDVLIDISAMPRSIFMPLIAKALHILDAARKKNHSLVLPNLHVVVCENLLLDYHITPVGLDDTADYVHGLRGLMDVEAEQAKVWIPLLGTSRSYHLDKIYQLVSQEETCPLLPLPSNDPRKVDKLLLEYRNELDRWRVETRNIMFAAEGNAFAVYRQVLNTAYRYHQTLGLLDGCKTAVSALSSKSFALGALLAAYDAKSQDLEVGLAHVETSGYEMQDFDAEILNQNVLSTFWLSGECYD
jgi:hypothetical protein